MSSSSRSSDSTDVNPRLIFLKLLFKNIQLEDYRLEDTIKDWIATPGRSIYFNGEEALEDKPNAARIQIAIKMHLTNTNPEIVKYIERYSHAKGFLHISASYTTGILTQLGKIIQPEEHRFDFIENADGSVTCVESFCINYYIKPSTPSTQIKPKEQGRPIAIVITESNIKFESGEIKHKLTSDMIILLDNLGEKLFSDISDKRYQVSKTSIESQFQKDIAKRVTAQQKQREAKQVRKIDNQEALSTSKVKSKSTTLAATRHASTTVKSTKPSPIEVSLSAVDLEVSASELLADPDDLLTFRSSTYKISQALPKDSSEQAFEETLSYSPNTADDASSEISEDEINVTTLEANENPRKRTSPCV